MSPDDLRAQLFAGAAGWRQIKANPGAWLMEELIARKGEAFIAQPLPAGFKRMPMKHCFDNAGKLAGRRKGLTYAEGYAMKPFLPFLFLHAWVVDAAGRVIDPTWDQPETAAYIGIRFSKEDYKVNTDKHSSSCFQTGRYAIINRELVFNLCPDLERLMEHET